MKVAEDRPARKPERKVRVPQNALLVRFVLSPAGKILLGLAATLIVVAVGVFAHFYLQYSKLIDERLRGGPYTTTSRIYAAPTVIAVNDASTPGDLAATLRHAGYNENRNNPIGYYTLRADAIEIFPGNESYFDQEAATVRFAGGKIHRIVSLGDNSGAADV